MSKVSNIQSGISCYSIVFQNEPLAILKIVPHMRELMPTSLRLAGRQIKSFDNRSENKAHFICNSVLLAK